MHARALLVAAAVAVASTTLACAHGPSDDAGDADEGERAAAAIDDAPSDAFVERRDGRLWLAGSPFRFAGANVYWLGLAQDADPHGAYPAHARVHEALAAAKAMGATVVRSHTLGVSSGTPLSVEPARGVFNEAAFDAIDYAIATAHALGLRLIVPLTDQYHYYHGGKHDFVSWAGYDASSCSDCTGGAPSWGGCDCPIEQRFYYDDAVVALFEEYVTHLLEHVNPRTGIAYKDDPTILAWETGNELGGWHGKTGAPYWTWTERIATLLKALAPHTLVGDGTDGVSPDVARLTSVDLVTRHGYPRDAWDLAEQTNEAKAAGKVMFVGEYDWRAGGLFTPSLDAYLGAIESEDAIAGDLFWSLFGHDDACGALVTHGDGLTMHWPGDDDDMRGRAEVLRRHGYRMSGHVAPSPAPPAVACGPT